MAQTRLIATLLRLLDVARSRELELARSLSDAERLAAGTVERWSARDLIAHITSWHRFGATLLTAAMNGETPAPPGGQINEINARFFAENQAKPWAQVLAEVDQAVARLSGLLPQFSDEDLLDPARYPWRRGQPLAPAITRPVYWHPLIHLSEYYIQHGETASSSSALESIRAELIGTAATFEAWPELRGNTLYMLADGYALSGATDQALAMLREALPLAPMLVEWSKRDPSLASLRADAGYAALYA